ncbi:MAG: putative transposase [Paraglaciecola sp.]|jgi:putative transposase
MELVEIKRINISLACRIFSVSEFCCRYQRQLSDENALIADWLVCLTHNQHNWGYVLYFLYLRNVKNYKWNHKGVYRVYCDLELNLRIKPSKRLVREKPQKLTVPRAIDEIWSMNDMQSSSEDGHNFQLFYVIDDLNKEGLAIDVDL